MTIEELKTMKERTDKLCKTLSRDREILQEEKKRLYGEVSNNLEKFLQEIKEHIKLISLQNGKKTGFKKYLPDGTRCQFDYCSSYTRIILTKEDYGTLTITDIDGDWKIRVTERKSRLGGNSLEDILIPIFLQNHDSILKGVAWVVASSIEQGLQEEKNKNDNLYENIIKAKEVLK